MRSKLMDFASSPWGTDGWARSKSSSTASSGNSKVNSSGFTGTSSASSRNSIAYQLCSRVSRMPIFRGIW